MNFEQNEIKRNKGDDLETLKQNKNAPFLFKERGVN